MGQKSGPRINQNGDTVGTYNSPITETFLDKLAGNKTLIVKREAQWARRSLERIKKPL